MKLKFGLKIWSHNYETLDGVKRLIKKKIFDFIEILPVPNSALAPYKKIKAPYIIHIAHENFGLNIADKRKEKVNLELINNSIKWADELSAPYLILHPGWGDLNNALNFLGKISDKRILIENMPKIGLDGQVMIGAEPEEVKKLMGDKFGFCLDFGHAIKASSSFKKNYKEYIKDFLKLRPKIFHISDGILDNEVDEHLTIGEGEYDFKFLLDCVLKNNSKLVTLETSKTDFKSVQEDLKNIKKLKQLL